MPGRSASDSWGELPLLVDTSAWARAGHPTTRDRWLAVLLGDRLRLSPLIRIEILLSARGGSQFDTLAERLDTIRAAPLSSSIVRAAEAGMRGLAHRSAGAQRLPVVDYLVAATAQELGGAVIHYDRDYDTLAELMEFESIWLAPAGALP
ncbi:MAG TPA: PIN domain-containing protein [Solirubrobacterales bacterium]